MSSSSCKSLMRFAVIDDADAIDSIMSSAYPAFLVGLSPEVLAERKKRLVAAIGEYRVAIRNENVIVGCMLFFFCWVVGLLFCFMNIFSDLTL